MLHAPVSQPQQALNQYLRSHYSYYGIAGNIQSLLRLSRLTEKLWRKTLSRRSQDGEVHWEKFQKLKHSFPLVRPKLSITSVDFQA
jgi:RNA-directed DNA polymerase